MGIPGIGAGHLSILLQTASKLNSPFWKYSGAIRHDTCENKLLNGKRVTITKLWKQIILHKYIYITILKKIPSGNSLLVMMGLWLA